MRLWHDYEVQKIIAERDALKVKVTRLEELLESAREVSAQRAGELMRLNEQNGKGPIHS